MLTKYEKSINCQTHVRANYNTPSLSLLLYESLQSICNKQFRWNCKSARHIQSTRAHTFVERRWPHRLQITWNFPRWSTFISKHPATSDINIPTHQHLVHILSVNLSRASRAILIRLDNGCGRWSLRAPYQPLWDEVSSSSWDKATPWQRCPRAQPGSMSPNCRI